MDSTQGTIVDGMSRHYCDYCNNRLGFKVDGRGNWICHTCFNIPTIPVIPKPYKNLGRNDKCPCKSGKKFKHCHLKVYK